MIEFDKVSRSYGSKVAVENLSLTVPKGELFALLGPNGAGKTTTIKMLVSLLRPNAGSVRVCGYDVVAEPRQATACLGYVPEEPFLYDKLSGREFLEFVGEMRGLAPPEIAERIAREADYFDLDDFLDDLTETYSHGMRQRLIFAAALLHEPAVAGHRRADGGPRSPLRAPGEGHALHAGRGRHHGLPFHAHALAGRGDRRPHRDPRPWPVEVPRHRGRAATRARLTANHPGSPVSGTDRREPQAQGGPDGVPGGWSRDS